MSDNIAIYVHWPFCLSKCPYCDFNSHVRGGLDTARFGAALQRELRADAISLGRRRVTSVFFGGGTPSLMDPKTVAAVLDDIGRLFRPADDIEITLEANPTSVEAARLADFRAAGVNRISVGIQSLDDSALAFLGRHHSAAEATSALSLARRLFDRVSVDLIYARPGQNATAWRSELRAALSIASDHLSLYQLTIEPATKFETLYRQGRFVLPDDDTAAALYEVTEEECARAGLAAYEVSNYARAGQESRHNLAYWRYNDYAGVGAGAHGRISIDGALLATRRHRAPEVWLSKVEETGDGSVSRYVVDPADRAREALLMGLRLSEGIHLGHFQARTGQTLEQSIDATILRRCVEEGYLLLSSDRLAATREGRLRLDAMLPRLVN